MTTAGPLTLAALLRTSPSLEPALRYARRAAAGDSPILIVGEPGTGRSTLARVLHQESPRAGGPLIEVDPAAIPSSLFESELFGYRKGAFTGAERDGIGRVRLAAGGTLVLDHIEEIPVAAQPKLLRVVAERRYSPLGGPELDADIRIIAIGPEDLAARVERGAFRSDLFYRLEVLSLRLPPLRERRQDLPKLIDLVLSDLAERFGHGRLGLSPAAHRWMAEHSWPGNLRELRNVLERSIILRRGDLLDPAPAAAAEGRPQSLVELEQRAIRKALAYTRGHQGRAAELLGISRKTLWEKRRRYGIP